MKKVERNRQSRYIEALCERIEAVDSLFEFDDLLEKEVAALIAQDRKLIEEENSLPKANTFFRHKQTCSGYYANEQRKEEIKLEIDFNKALIALLKGLRPRKVLVAKAKAI